MLNREDDKSTAVIIENPRSADFEVCLFHNCSQVDFLLFFKSLFCYCTCLYFVSIFEGRVDSSISTDDTLSSIIVQLPMYFISLNNIDKCL